MDRSNFVAHAREITIALGFDVGRSVPIDLLLLVNERL
jgi:hypothetical protein